MPDENNGLPPQGTSNPPDNQPQVDPNAAPQGTTPSDNQQIGTTETPEQKAVREQLYQTKYQDEKLRNDRLETSLNELREQMAAGLPFSAPQTPIPGQPGTMPNLTDEELPDGVDPINNPAGYAKYLQVVIGRTVSQQAKDAIIAAQREAEYKARAQMAVNQFTKFVKDNQIPQPLINEGYQECLRRWSDANGNPTGTPEAVVEWVADYCARKTGTARTDATTAQAIADGIAKKAALPGVAQPAGGAAPPPASQDQEKKRQEEAANFIAPDSVYGGSG